MKTRSLRSKKGKTRRFRMKRGGQKKNNNTAIIASQMGGAATTAQIDAMNTAMTAAAAAQATVVTNGGPAVNINLDLNSVKSSMDTFGNSVVALNQAIGSEVNSAVSHVNTALAGASAAAALQSATKSLMVAFFGDGTSANAGLYGTVLKNSGFSPYTPPPLTDSDKAADNTAAYTAAVALYKKDHPGLPFPLGDTMPTTPVTINSIAQALGVNIAPSPA